MKIEIRWSPKLEQVANKYGKVNLGRALQAYIKKLAFDTEKYAKKQTPVGDTGNLWRSITTDVGRLFARVKPHIVYAFWIHEGWMIRNGKRVEIKGLGKAGTPVGGQPYMELGTLEALDKIDVDKFIGKELAKLQ